MHAGCEADAAGELSFEPVRPVSGLDRAKPMKPKRLELPSAAALGLSPAGLGLLPSIMMGLVAAA